MSQTNQLEQFRMQLEKLKASGVNIDPDKITEEVVKAPQELAQELAKLSKEEREEEYFNMAVQKVLQLMSDWKDHYRGKGRRLNLIVRIEKDNSADAYGEKYIFDDNLQVINMIEIGTKGKYEKVLEEA